MSQPFFIRRLTRSERKTIAKLRKKPPNVKVYQRAQAVYFSAQGLKVQKIAPIVNRDRSIVSRWLHAFQKDGLAALWPGKSSGPTPPAARGELAASPDHLRAVYQLADHGHSLASIADQVGLTVGDIEMMLSLRTSD